MQQSPTSWARAIMRALLLAPAVLLLGSCSLYEDSDLPGSAAAMAKDQIMLVRADPPSFGYYRLTTQVKIYPDLELFVNKRGVPDFLAETADNERHYFILYYLQNRQAFACRTQPSQRQGVEFSGPYPITTGEYRLLDGFRKGEFR